MACFFMPAQPHLNLNYPVIFKPITTVFTFSRQFPYN